MAGLLKTLFILALIYYGFRFIGKVVVPMVLGKAMRKAQQRYQDQMQGQGAQKSTKVGEVTIENIPEKNQQKRGKEEGEYVDFEEIETKKP